MHEANKERLERETDSPKSSNDSPAGFIRIRRISGDWLSKGTDQELSTTSTTTNG